MKGSILLDVPTLSVAVIIVLVLTSMAMVAHWRVNRTIEGMGKIALGLFLNFAAAAFFFSSWAMTQADYLVLLGLSLFIVGHVFFWLGLADFWGAKTSSLYLGTKIFTGLVLSGLLLIQLSGLGTNYLRALTAVACALLAFGCMSTVASALGGSLGLYKGIVRKTSIGAAAAVGLFCLHGVYALYHTAVRAGLIVHLDTTGFTTIRSVAQLEMMVFAISVTLIVIIITAERLQAELKIQQMLDPLTKALNRRAFVEVVKAVLAQARRNNEPVSLIMLDIDKFKRINTVHGRTVGDQVLSQFSDLVTDGLRDQDVFCRFGGEEFIFLLPGTSEEGADLVATRIRARIEKAAISPSGLKVKLSVVMGIVTARGDDLDVDSMLDLVDRRMNRAQAFQLRHTESS